MKTDYRLAKLLLDIQAVKLSLYEPFQWASGILSPIYCDNRITLSYPHVRQVIIDGFIELSGTFGQFDAIAGVATAGIPHGMNIAQSMGLPFIYVRSKPKDHGRKNIIEGKATPGQRVLVIEDLISTGGSSLRAVEALREAGINPIGISSIFTYEFDEAASKFLENNISWASITKYSLLIEVALDRKYITHVELERLQQWRQNPSALTKGDLS